MTKVEVKDKGKKEDISQAEITVREAREAAVHMAKAEILAISKATMRRLPSQVKGP